MSASSLILADDGSDDSGSESCASYISYEGTHEHDWGDDSDDGEPHLVPLRSGDAEERLALAAALEASANDSERRRQRHARLAAARCTEPEPLASAGGGAWDAAWPARVQGLVAGAAQRGERGLLRIEGRQRGDACQVRALPAELLALTLLERLVLDGCAALRELPPQLGRLTSLRTLDLSGCKALASLPESLTLLRMPVKPSRIPLFAFISRAQGSSGAVATMPFVWRSHAKSPTTRAWACA